MSGAPLLLITHHFIMKFLNQLSADSAQHWKLERTDQIPAVRCIAEWI